MALVRISCVNKSDRTNPHERINNVGGVNGDGSRWKLSEDAAIAGIKAGKWTRRPCLPLLQRPRRYPSCEI